MKDLYGIWFVLTMLEDFSNATAVALKSLQRRQPATWTRTFNENLQTWVTKASPRDWNRLTSQDPEQRMTEAAFRGLVERLTDTTPQDS